MPNCIFCTIADSSLLSQVIYEDSLLWVIHDGYPVADPHLLIIPKKHYETYAQLDESQFAELETAMNSLRSYLGRDCLFFEHGKIGQTVAHAHIHAIRFRMSINELLKEIGINGELLEISGVKDLRRYLSYLYIAKGDASYVFLPEKEASVLPAILTNTVAKMLQKPYPAANREKVKASDMEKYKGVIWKN